ncbi:MAG: InlB B-repeat-containing protein, partial [Oscillospiraceae bacterium]|nr:InlB B-repeat-containing protein [Oscillospiraceae bacterium]
MLRTEMKRIISAFLAVMMIVSMLPTMAFATDESVTDETYTEIPAEGDGTETPAEGDGTETPAEGDGTETPAEGDGTETPAEGDGTDTPAEGDGTDTPAEGDGNDAPVEGEGTVTPENPDENTGTSENPEQGSEGAIVAPEGSVEDSGDTTVLAPETSVTTPEVVIPTLLDEVKAAVDELLVTYGLEVGMSEEEIEAVVLDLDEQLDPEADMEALEALTYDLNDEELEELQAYEAMQTWDLFCQTYAVVASQPAAPTLLDEVKAAVDELLVTYGLEVGMSGEEIEAAVLDMDYRLDPKEDMWELEQLAADLTDEELEELQDYEPLQTWVEFYQVYEEVYSVAMYSLDTGSFGASPLTITEKDTNGTWSYSGSAPVYDEATGSWAYGGYIEGQVSATGKMFDYKKNSSTLVVTNNTNSIVSLTITADVTIKNVAGTDYGAAVPSSDGTYVYTLGSQDSKEIVITANDSRLSPYTTKIKLSSIIVTEVKTTPNFSVGTNVYEHLEEALSAANAGSDKTVIMLAKEYTVNKNITIPSNVSLLLPYGGDYTINGEKHDHPYANTPSAGESTDKSAMPGVGANCTLDVQGATITVSSGAALIIGGQYGYSSGGIAGQTCGAYGYLKMDNSSVTKVAEGGILSVKGFITGGKVISESGKIYESFTINDFHGGTYTMITFNEGKCPFNLYSLNNIQSTIQLNDTSELYGYCYINATAVIGSSDHLTTTRMIGQQDAFIQIKEGTTVEIVYNKNSKVTDREEYGQCVFNIEGGAEFGSIELSAGSNKVDTSSVHFAIPYTMHFNLANGDYSVPNKFKIMPGASVYVESDATLTVQSELAIYDGFDAVAYAGKHYPSGSYLATANSVALSERGRLIVDGTLVVKDGAKLGGLIETNNEDSSIIIECTNSENLSITLQDGVVKDTSSGFGTSATATNLTGTALQGSYYDANGNRQLLSASKTYYSVKDANLYKFEEEGYYQQYGADDGTLGVAEEKKYTKKQVVSGAWDDVFEVVFYANGGTFTDDSEVNKTTVTFASNTDGTADDTISGITEPSADMVRPGYTFTGWNTAADGSGTPYGENDVPAQFKRQNLNLYAQWQADTYKVTFDSKGGSTVDSVDVPFGSAIPVPGDPQKEGHKFIGWYTDEECTTAFDFTTDTMPAKNLILYAKWNVNSYNLAWNVTESSITSEESAYTHGKVEYGTVIIAPEVASRDGYDMTWSPELKKDATMPADNVTYTTVWTGKGYTVFFDYGEGQGTVGDMKVTYGSAYGTLPGEEAVQAKPDGYHLSGWKYENTVIMADTVVNVLADHTLQAIWAPNTDTKYTVHYYEMDVEGNYPDTPVVEPKTGTTDAKYEPKAAAEGFTRVSVTDNNESNGYTAGTVAPDGSTVVTVYYSRNKHNLTWNPNDGSFTENDPSGEVYFGAHITEPTVSREGYTFQGWEPTVESPMPAEAKTYTAQWDAIEYEVCFNSQGGSKVASITADVDSKISAPAEPTKEGYTFDGWYKDSNYTTAFDFAKDTVPVNGITLYAKWSLNSYTLTFVDSKVSDDDTLKETVANSVPYGAEINNYAPAWEKVGYKLSWNPELAADATMPAEAKTYTADWTANDNTKYTVEYVLEDLNGAYTLVQTKDTKELTGTTGEQTEAIADKTYTGFTAEAVEQKVIAGDGRTVVQVKYSRNSYALTIDLADGSDSTTTSTLYGATITLPVPTRTGYTFLYWTDETGEQNVPATMPAEPVVVKAAWKVIEYTITYNNLVDGINPESNPGKYTVKDHVVLQAPTRTGYTFTGWSLGNTVITEIAEGSTGNRILTAGWEQNTYVVKFCSNDGMEQSVTQNATYDASFTLMPNTFTRTGYTFTGWNTVADGSGETYSDKQAEVKNLATEGTVCLYAQWQANTYTVTFDANTGEGEGMDSVSVKYGTDAQKLPKNTFVKTGHTFAGWNTAQNGSGTPYADEAEIANLTDDMTLYAQWSANKYIVKFESGDEKASGSMEAQEFAYGEIEALNTNGFELTGHKFVKWQVKGDASRTYVGGYDRSDLVETAGGEITLIAVWEKNAYTIRFNSNGGSAVNAITQYYDSTVNAPTDPEWAGYRFAGWLPAVPERIPAQDVECVAQWNSYLDLLNKLQAEHADVFTAEAFRVED